MHITVDHVSLTYPSGKQALRDISLELPQTGLIGLLGPNGAGKSTLMKLLVASLLPSQGTLYLDGQPLARCEKQLKASLGYLPQSFGLYDELRVQQFLDYMAALKGISQPRKDIARVLEETHLTEKSAARIRTLSGGQRQRVGIAQALLGSPELLIFDEPTVGLDPEERISFRNLFSRAAQNRIVLLSTHIIEDIQSITGRLVVLHHGAILFDGSPAALIQRAAGHVGVFETDMSDVAEHGFHITARVNTARGIACRIVSEALPPFAVPAEPTLEDAYMYCITQMEEAMA